MTHKKSSQGAPRDPNNPKTLTSNSSAEESGPRRSLKRKSSQTLDCESIPAAVPQYNNKRVTLAPFTPSFVHGQSQTMEMRVCLGFLFHSYFIWYNNCHCCFSHSLLYIDLRSYFCGRHNVLVYYCWLLTYYIFTMMIHKKGYASLGKANES